MASPKKQRDDAASGEMLFKEIFRLVEQLNAQAGPAMAERGTKGGNLIFNPKIVIEEDGERQYSCYVDIYTPQGTDDGPEMGLQWSGLTFAQFKQALKLAQLALSPLAREAYVAETYTVGLLKPDGEESEIYAPAVLEPGVYSINED